MTSNLGKSLMRDIRLYDIGITSSSSQISLWFFSSPQFLSPLIFSKISDVVFRVSRVSGRPCHVCSSPHSTHFIASEKRALTGVAAPNITKAGILYSICFLLARLLVLCSQPHVSVADHVMSTRVHTQNISSEKQALVESVT